MSRLYHLVRPELPYIEPHIAMEAVDELSAEHSPWVSDWKEARAEYYKGPFGGEWLTEEELRQEPGGETALAAWRAGDDSQLLELDDFERRAGNYEDLQMLADRGNVEAQALIVAEAPYEEVRDFLRRHAEAKDA